MRHRYRMAAILSRWHGFLYRLLNGRLVAHYANADFLLLTTMGRLSRRRRTVALLYVTNQGNPAVIASFGGNSMAPAWLLNIRDEPSVKVQIGGDRWGGSARIASHEEREALWPKFVTVFSGYEKYQSKTSRIFPVVIITPD